MRTTQEQAIGPTPRVVLVTSALGLGPEGTVTRNAALGFSRLGKPCDVVLLDGSDGAPDVEHAGKTVRLGLGSGAGHRPSTVVALARALAELGPDGVVAYPAGLVPACRLATGRLGVPLVAWEGNFVGALASELRLHQRLLPLAQRIAYRRVHAVAGKAKVIVSDLRASLPERVGVAYVPNSVDPPSLWNAARAAPVDPAGFTICSLGHLNRRKGFDLLLEALIEASTRLPDDWRLVAIGEPYVGGRPSRAAPLRRIETLLARPELRDRVVMPGRIPNPFGMLASADLFVHASRLDPCPNALLEAMALSRPVVATDSAGATEDLLDAGRAGDLCRPDDPAALGSAIVKLASDEAARRELGAAAAARALEFPPERSAKELAELFTAPRGR